MTMTLVESVTVGSGGASSIEFTSIPQDGTDLVVLVSARDVSGFGYGITRLTFNNDTGANYSTIFLSGEGSGTPSSSSVPNTNYIFSGVVTGGGSTANSFSSQSIYISNYSGATTKTVSSDSVVENNATDAPQRLNAGVWNSTATITSIELKSSWGVNFAQHSTASLYKITKGSDGTTVVS